MTKPSSARMLSVSDLNTDITKSEPRIQDVRLGERLGMSQPLNIRKTIEKNRPELEQYGPIHAAREMVKIGSKARRCIEVHWLNEAQSLLLCMFARTERAALVRKEVISVYLAVRRGASSAPKREPGLWATTIGTDGMHVLGELIAKKVKPLPLGIQRSVRMRLWSRLHTRFNVPRAELIPADQMEAAANFLAAYMLEGPSEHRMRPVKFTRLKPAGQPNMQGAKRNDKAIKQILRELSDWGHESLADPAVKATFEDAITAIEGLRVSCWTCIDESLSRMGLAMATLRRWQADEDPTKTMEA